MSLTGAIPGQNIVAVRVGLACRTFGFNHSSLNRSLNHGCQVLRLAHCSKPVLHATQSLQPTY
jgi:hypothetical protein